MRLLVMSRTCPLMQLFLYSFKQGRRKNWLKASGEIFATMCGESKVCAIGKKSSHGSFPKWRSGPLCNTVLRQKLRH